MQAFAEAVIDDGACPDALEHAQLIALGVDLPTEGSCPFVGLDDPPSDFALSAWETGLKDLGRELEAVGSSSAISSSQPQLARLRGSGPAPLIADADSASETTDQQ